MGGNRSSQQDPRGVAADIAGLNAAKEARPVAQNNLPVKTLEELKAEDMLMFFMGGPYTPIEETEYRNRLIKKYGECPSWAEIYKQTYGVEPGSSNA